MINMLGYLRKIYEGLRLAVLFVVFIFLVVYLELCGYMDEEGCLR